MAFDQAIADKICERISDGKSLRKAVDDLPTSPASVLAEVAKDPEFAERYARAMNARTEAAVDDLGDIRDRVLAGQVAPDVARVAAGITQWTASKMLPKKYGDRLQTDNETRVTVVLRDMRKESGE